MRFFQQWSLVVRIAQAAIAIAFLFLAARCAGIAPLVGLLVGAWIFGILALMAHPTPSLRVKFMLAPLIAAILIAFGIVCRRNAHSSGAGRAQSATSLSARSISAMIRWGWVARQ